MHRRRFVRTLAATSLAMTVAAAAGCSGDADSPTSASGGAQKPEQVTYLTSFGTFGRDAYAYVAKEKGFFRDAGFEVDIKPGNGTGDNIKMIVSGQAHYTPIDMTGGILQMGKGDAKDFTAVAGIQQRTMAAIVTLEGNGISRPQDLEGKKIADTAGSVVQNLFPTYAKLANVDAGKVSWVNGTAQTLMGTLASGSVDGIGQFVVGKPTVETVAKGRKAVVLPYSDVLTDLYGNVLITSTANATKNPEQVKKFTAALLKGLDYAINNPDEAGEILKKYVPTAIPAAGAAELKLMAAYVRSANSGVPVGALDSERVARSIAILQGAGSSPAGMTPDKIISFDLVPKA